jgi:hypothetical protein
MGFRIEGVRNGYGHADRKMSNALRSARTQEQADQIARDNGLKDCKDAVQWLRERG